MKHQFISNRKQLALLIDPDKTDAEGLTQIARRAEQSKVDLILVGGSLVVSNIAESIEIVKSNCKIPVYIFPGNANQVSNNADGILILSLISGRNAEFLIGNHVNSAIGIKRSGIDTLAVGYMLIESGKTTSVEYMSNTRPIPRNKIDIAVATAIAGEMLGMKAIYLEGGSGAEMPVDEKMINAVKKNIDIPLIVGGGIRTIESLQNALTSGADIVVIGTAIEKNNQLLEVFASEVHNFNSKN